MNYQNTDKDCGRASSRTLLRLLYKSRKYEAAYFEKEKMNNFLSIQNGLKKYGVDIKGYEVDQKGLDEIKRPFICQLKREESYHFVVASGNKRKLKIYDSSCGIYKINKKKFLNEFTGKVLEVQNKIEKDINDLEVKLFSFKEILLYTILSIFEMIIFILGICLTTNFGDITYLFLGTICSIVISFLKRQNIILLNRKIDSRLLLPYLASYKNEKNYEDLINIKNEYFSNLTTLINHLEVIFILSLLASFENFLLFCGICLILVFTYFFLNFANQKLNCLKISADIKEKKLRHYLIKEYDKEKALKIYGQQAKVGGKYMWYYYLLRLVPFAIALIYVLVMLYQTQKLSFETLIFNGGYLIALILSLIKIDEISSKGDFSLSKIVDFKDYEKLSFDKDKVVYCTYLDKKNINQ